MLEHHNTQLSKTQHTCNNWFNITIIGLFGTVIGVVKAFKDMAAFQSAGPAVYCSGNISSYFICNSNEYYKKLCN